jgi:hypothetical protein
VGLVLPFDRPRKSTLAKIKTAGVRLGLNGTRSGFKFAERMFAALPELKNA